MADCTWITIQSTWSNPACCIGEFTDGLVHTITEDVLVNTITQETTTTCS